MDKALTFFDKELVLSLTDL